MRRYFWPLWIVLGPGVAAAALAAAAAAPRVERGNLILDNIPQAPPELIVRLDGYLAARQATPLGWSPKGQLLVSTRFGDVDQLHVVEKALGTRRQLTFVRDPITDGAFSPDPGQNSLVYVKDDAGNGRFQLYYQRVGEPAARLLTDGKSLNGAPLWSNAGREVAFFTTARDGATYDIDVVEPAAGSLAHLAVGGDSGGAWYPLDWSPDDRKLLVLKYVSAAEGYLYVVDLSTGQKREVDPAPGKVGIGGAKFSRDGQGVYVISDRDDEFRRLRYVNLFTKERSMISDHVPWDVEEIGIARDGRYLAYVSNEAGVSRLNLVDLHSHQDLVAPRMPAAGLIDHLRFDADGKHLAFGFASQKSPRDVYVLDIQNNRLEAWTQSEAGAVDPEKFVAPRLSQVPSFDRQRQIPVFVYEPTASGPHPALLLLPGSPHGQFRPGFDPWIQFVVNELGMAVIAPNIRGSSGYGKTYAALGSGALRDDTIKELGALIVWVDAQAAFSSKHVTVAGGYLALAAMVNFGDRLDGGADLAGISDFVDYLANSPPALLALRRAEYGDEHDPDTRAYLRRISPLTSAERINRPLLVMQGRNDADVPPSQSDQLVNRVRSHGTEVGYLQATDEGRDFGKQVNREAYYQAFATFLKSLQ